MTGFGRCEMSDHNISLGVELTGINRKQTEIVINLPRNWSALETEIRQKIGESISRGRVNVLIAPVHSESSAPEVKLNEELALAYMRAFDRIKEMRGGQVSESLTDYLRIPELMVNPQDVLKDEEVKPLLFSTLEKALEMFLAMREAEGEHLKQDLLARIGQLRSYVNEMGEYAPEVVSRYREMLMKRLEEAGLPLDLQDERLVKEIAIFAERCDISEEFTRLESHFVQFESKCALDEAVGRPLDFLCQEMNREFNTIGSKANDARLAHLVVASKTELEKIREQVQNIE